MWELFLSFMDMVQSLIVLLLVINAIVNTKGIKEILKLTKEQTNDVHNRRSK